MAGSRRNQGNDQQLEAILQQSAADYRREQMARFENGIDIEVNVLPLTAAPNDIIDQYPVIAMDTFAGSDYIILPQRYADRICPDINTYFSIGLTIFKVMLDDDIDIDTCDQSEYMTLLGYIIGSDQEYAYIDPRLFNNLNMRMGQKLKLKTVPHNRLYAGTRVILTPNEPLMFLHIKDQSKFLEGHIGKKYRVLYIGQDISIYSEELNQVLSMTVTELFYDYTDIGETFYPATGPAIITDTNLEVEFRVSEEDIATFETVNKPPSHTQPIDNRRHKRLRIKGILPVHLEQCFDNIELIRIEKQQNMIDNMGWHKLNAKIGTGIG